MTTTIRVEEPTKVRLEKLGKYGDSMDDILNSLLDLVDKKKGGCCT
jgi:hypothetical protein